MPAGTGVFLEKGEIPVVPRKPLHSNDSKADTDEQNQLAGNFFTVKVTLA